MTEFTLSAATDRGRPVVVLDLGRGHGYFCLDAEEIESLKTQLDELLIQARKAEGGAP